MPCYCSHELADHGEDQSKASPDAWCRLCSCAYFETEQVVILPVVSAVVVPTAAPVVAAEQDLGLGEDEDYAYTTAYWGY